MLATRLPTFWMQRKLVNYCLLPLSALFWLTSRLRYFYYHVFAPPSALKAPVIIVGNITSGGSGKTPLVAWLALALQAAGKRPGIISRGYGRNNTAVCEVHANTPAAQCGDEPLLLKHLTGVPIFVGADRPASALALLATYPECDVLLSDDGMQHYALTRQIEIAVFDARGVGNGWLLPAGPLRETVTRLQDVQAIVCNGVDCNQLSVLKEAEQTPRYHMQLQATHAYRLADPNDRRPLASFAQLPVAAIAGIGQPERFFTTLRHFQLQVHAIPLPDHFAYHSNPFASITENIIFITEKDAVKCYRYPDPRVWVLPVRASVIADHSDTPDLTSLILNKLHG